MALCEAAADGDLGSLRAALTAADAELEATTQDGSTAFLLACSNGHAECIAALAKAGCDTAARSSNGSTGLIHAACSGSAAAVEAVLSVGGVELEATTQNGFTAFLLACSKGHAECIAALAKVGCDTAARSSNGYTGLMNAAYSGSAVALETVLVLDGLELEARDEDGDTAFLWACNKGHAECIAALAKVGCDTAARSSNGYTGLMNAAALAGSAAAVEAVLVVSEAELEARDEDGDTAFLLACSKGHAECIAALAKAGCDTAARSSDGSTGLIHAACSGSAAAVEAVLSVGGVELEATMDGAELEATQAGNTAFLLACSKGHAECIAALAKVGCDTAARNSNGYTGLMNAAYSGSEVAVEAVLALGGVELEARDEDGDTAFLWACNKGSAECIAALAEVGCNTAARSSDGSTGLIHAAGSGSAAAVEAVLAVGGVELEATDQDGYTAFLLACSKGHAECIAALAEGGCDTAARSSDGGTGLMHAAASGSATAVEAVLAVGGTELEATDHYDSTAFLWACHKGDAECIAALAEAGCNTFTTITIEGTPRKDALEVVDSSLRPLIEAMQQKQWLREAPKIQAQKRAKLIESAKSLVDANETTRDLQQAIVLIKEAQRDERYGEWSSSESEAAIEIEHEAHKLCLLREQKALQAEAELIALIDGEEQGAAASDAKATDKARKKKEKRRRQLQQRAQAKAMAAEKESATIGVGPLEPEPEPDSEVNMATSQATQTKSKKKKKKKKKQQQQQQQQQAQVGLEAPHTILEPGALEAELEPEPELVAETAAEREQREREAALQLLASLPMAEWTVEQTVEWVGLAFPAVLPSAAVECVQAFVVEDETDGEDLEELTPKRLQKDLKKAGVQDPALVTQVLLEHRDAMLSQQQGSSSGGRQGKPLALRVEFDRKADLIGSGRFGHVFKCKLDGEDGYAVKRVDAIKAREIAKEIEVLTRAVKTDKGGHPNVVRYLCREEDQDFVYICMELCDVETLDSRVRRMESTASRLDAGTQLFSGVQYLHELHIIHRDLKPANILFKGDVLKICDMGQSRILLGGSTAVETGSGGGTFGWMSPEELSATKGRHHKESLFESRLAGDIHTAGGIFFFLLTGGLHAYGPRNQTPETVNGDWFVQQSNIMKGRYDLKPLAQSGEHMACAADLIARMLQNEPKRRPTIGEVVSHPAMWDAETKLRHCMDWHKSWERGSPALERRFKVHASLVQRLLGDRPEGWLTKLEAHPLVLEQLLADGRHYNGREVTELLRAIRNVAEHWFQPRNLQEELVLESMTGRSAEEIRRGQATELAAMERAEAIERFFLSDTSFGELLVLFSTSNST
eukprot:COSAG01_NODE_2496_length_7573_cov_15.650120_1_plen_1328_part_00